MGDKGKHQHKESNSKSIRTNAIHLSAYCVPVTQLNVNNHHSHLWWAQFSRDVQLVNKNNVTRCEKCRNKYVQRHRGDGVFLKRFLKRNQGKLPGGPKRQKSNLSRAEQEPQVVWQCWSKVSLEVNRDGDEGDGALESCFHARPQQDTTHGYVSLALEVYKLFSPKPQARENQSLKLGKYYAYICHIANNIG